MTHSFIKLLADKGLLNVCFTQNIDSLEAIAGVPQELIIEAHGSFATQRCIRCKQPYPSDAFAAHLRAGTIPRCELPAPTTPTQTEPGPGDEHDAAAAPPIDNKYAALAASLGKTLDSADGLCHGLIKPDIVFFGEPLPPAFFAGFPHTLDADLVLIMGTSLKVHPFASLAEMGACPRVLINRDPAGDIGTETDDVELLMSCDDAVREIARGMGWAAELDAAWAATALGGEAQDASTRSELDRIVANVGKVIGVKESTDEVDALAAGLAKLDVRPPPGDDAGSGGGLDRDTPADAAA